MGIFWPGRRLEEEPIEPYEQHYLKCKQGNFGTSMWGTFAALRGSSTRCEIATALVSMLRKRAVHIATDSLALVRKGNAYLDHLKDREATKLREEAGT